MRRLINTLILLLTFLRIDTVIAQSISIRFSIEMENEIDSLAVGKDSLLTVPFLLISYENQSDSNYYLPKVTFTDTQYPCMGTVMLQPIGWTSTLENHSLSEICGRFSDSSFVVGVGQFWDLYVNDSLMQTDGEEGNNAALDANTEIEDLRSLLTNSDTKTRFNEIDLLPENILSENNEYFILLKSGEKHVDKINLSLFRFFGGSYKFKLAPNYETTRLYRDIIVGSDLSLRYILLPLQVGPYYLYQGLIDNNSVFAKFDSHGKVVSVY